MSQHFGGRPSVLYENRYCDQNEFDIIINHEDGESKGSTDSTIKIVCLHILVVDLQFCMKIVIVIRMSLTLS